jgi:hypothetical protein
MKHSVLYPDKDILLTNLGIVRILSILFILLCGTIRFVVIKFVVIKLLFSDAFKTFNKIKFYKYYVTSGVIGYIGAEAIKRNATFFTKLRYSFLTMDWGLLILAMDAVSDVEGADDKYSEELNVACYYQLCEKIAKSNDHYNKVFEENIRVILNSLPQNATSFRAKTPMSNVSLYLVSKINKKMPWIIPKKNQSILQITIRALEECALLCKGQIDSFRQKLCDDKYNLYWYCKDVIYNKTIYIYSFIYLFAQDDEEGINASKLGQALLLANDLYLNRQLLDDMNDIAVDTNDGIFAGPSYLLCSDFNGKQEGNNSLYATLVEETSRRIEVTSLRQYSASFKINIRTNPGLSIDNLLQSTIPKLLISIIEDEKRYLPLYDTFMAFLQTCPRTVPLTTLFYFRCGKSLMKAKKIAYS